MALLDLVLGARVKGIYPQTAVTIVAVTRHGAESSKIVYRDALGSLGMQVVYRSDAALLEVVPETLPSDRFQMPIVFGWPLSLIH